MVKSYQTIYQANDGEIVEKKSRFIAAFAYVEREEEALKFIESKKKQYWNATHNCWAYVLGKRQEVVRCSDDGEPGGTAGKPMLDVLTGQGLCDVVAVVTRYFGGTLLGTGGLVRAYSKAVQEGLKESQIITRTYGVGMEIRTDYNGIGKIQYLLGQRGIQPADAEYGEDVRMKILLPYDQYDTLAAEIIEATSARAVITRQEERYFAVLNGEVLTGDALVKRAD